MTSNDAYRLLSEQPQDVKEAVLTALERREVGLKANQPREGGLIKALLPNGHYLSSAAQRRNELRERVLQLGNEAMDAVVEWQADYDDVAKLRSMHSALLICAAMAQQMIVERGKGK